jgi:hypothetical protein
MTNEDIKKMFHVNQKVYSFDGGIEELKEVFDGRGINTIKANIGLFFTVIDDMPIPSDSRIGEI